MTYNFQPVKCPDCGGEFDIPRTTADVADAIKAAEKMAFQIASWQVLNYYKSEEANAVLIPWNNAAVKLARTPPVPVDTIAVPREVVQGVREALNDALAHITYPSTCRNDVNKCIASLDAVLSEGEP